MCGIVGVIGADVDLTPALRALAHRGPDGEGVFRRAGVTLGHRRLAILDLGEAAAQPMERAGAGVIVFNGEIYDFEAHREKLAARFESRGDTEVLLWGLARHGVDFLRELHGMWT